MKHVRHLLILFACLPIAALAKPDTLQMLEQQKSLTTVSKITDIGSGDVEYRISLCPSKDETVDCDVFSSDGKHLTELADYAYLFAVYKGRYKDPHAAVAEGAKRPLLPMLQEAHDKGYADELVKAYSQTYAACQKAKDAALCILKQMRTQVPISLFKYEHRPGGAYSLVDVDENGKHYYDND